MRRYIFKKALVAILVLLFVFVSSINVISLENKQNQIISRGDPYFILLSDYSDGAGDENLWAVQLRFDIDLGIVESEFDNKTLPLITDEWVEIRVNIDLNIDWMEIYYGGELLHKKKWSAGPDNEGNGIVNLSAVNLFSDSTTSVYFDDFYLEEVGGGKLWSEDFDSYEDGSSIHGQGGWKGWDNDPEFTGYVSSFKNRSFPHSLEISYGTDIVREYFGNYSGEFMYTAWIYFPVNIAPIAPTISGPESGGVGEYYEYNFVATDSDSDDLWYFIDWGDGEFENWTGPFESGEEVTIGHLWFEKDVYKIRAKVRDELSFESKWSGPFYVNISNPPKKPTIGGPPSVKKGVEYEFSFISIDPDGDDVKFFIDWGDDNNESTDFYLSGYNVTIKHAWTNKGTYEIYAKAIDVFNAESSWSKFEIVVPRNIELNLRLNLVLKLSQIFPNMTRLINYLF